ncbi:hypothetical protein TNCV_977851 [Trichonephila clavipes]|nr:hypothetical protein TNCV_977851 [Trichonephila clavipes]
MVRKKKRAKNPRKNIALTAKEIESSSSPNKISENHTSKMEAKNENKIKQEENLDADEEKLKQPITIIKNDIRFEDLQTFSKIITWKYPFKHSLEILKSHRNTVTKLQQHRGTEGKNETLRYPRKSKSSKNEVIYPKYPVTRIPHHTNQFVRRQQYGGWNWRNDQSQHPDAITGSRYNVYSPQLYHLLIITRPFLFSGRSCTRETNDFHNDRQFCDPMLQLSIPVKEHKTIIRYSNLFKHENL